MQLFFKVKNYVKDYFDILQITSTDKKKSKEKISSTLYKIKLYRIHFSEEKKSEPWGKSGLVQNESSRAFLDLYKTKNQSHCML